MGSRRHQRKVTRARVSPACCVWHLPLVSADDQANSVHLTLPWQWGTTSVTMADRAKMEWEEKQISKEGGSISCCIRSTKSIKRFNYMVQATTETTAFSRTMNTHQ